MFWQVLAYSKLFHVTGILQWMANQPGNYMRRIRSMARIFAQHSCPFCKKPLSRDVAFCPYCGYNFYKAEPYMASSHAGQPAKHQQSNPVSKAFVFLVAMVVLTFIVLLNLGSAQLGNQAF